MDDVADDVRKDHDVLLECFEQEAEIVHEAETEIARHLLPSSHRVDLAGALKVLRNDLCSGLTQTHGKQVGQFHDAVRQAVQLVATVFTWRCKHREVRGHHLPRATHALHRVDDQVKHLVQENARRTAEDHDVEEHVHHCCPRLCDLHIPHVEHGDQSVCLVGK